MRPTRRTLSLLLSILALALGVAAQESTPKDPLEGHEGIRNYHRLRPDVATAGQPSDEAWADTRAHPLRVVQPRRRHVAPAPGARRGRGRVDGPRGGQEGGLTSEGLEKRALEFVEQQKVAK